MEDGLLVAIFVIALWLPPLGMALHWGVVTPEQENRLLAPFPALSTNLRDLASFPDGFASYLRDNFGFRGTLIRLQAIAKVKLLGVSTSPQVTLGKDGWLFYASEFSNKGERVAPPLTEQQLENWRKVLEARRDWLARQGVRYLFVISPSKQDIYPEYLPDIFRRNQETRMDQLMAYLKKSSNLKVLDLRPALSEAKPRHVLFFKTDTHMNSYGSLIAYQSLAGELSKMFPSIKPLSESDCVISKQKGGGDLAKMLGLSAVLTENIEALYLRQPAYAGSSSHPIRPINLGETIITEGKDQRLPRLVMFFDSGFGRLYPFLAQHFSRSVFAWLPEFDPELIRAEHPDIVIQEVSEVHLLEEPPVDPLEVRGLKFPEDEQPVQNPASTGGRAPEYNGYQDITNCQRVAGWAWDKSRPDDTLNVAVYDGNTLLAVIPAYQFRDDLIQAGIGDGRHGFSYEFPRGFRDVGLHSISVKVANAEFRLHNAPASLTCASP